MSADDPRDFGAAVQNGDEEEFRIKHDDDEEDEIFGFGTSHWTSDEESHAAD